MEAPRAVAFAVILLFIYLTPDRPVVRRYNPARDNALAEEKRQDFDVLANSTYGELGKAGLNLTGFRDTDNYAWDDLPKVVDMSRQQYSSIWEGVTAPIYQSVDGEVRGDFTAIKLGTRTHLNLTEIDPFGEYLLDTYQKNVTDQTGEITINIDDSGTAARPRIVKAKVNLQGANTPGTGYEFSVQGVHFSSGSMLMTTATRKFNAIPALPHFTLNQADFDASRTLMNESLTRIWNRIDDLDVPAIAIPNCELVIWLHQHPLPGSTRYISAIESELTHPEGAPIGTPPPMAFSAIAFSPDCDFILSASPVFGPKTEVYWTLVRRLLSAQSLVLILQIYLLKRQMERCATPSTRSRISYHSIGIAAFGDGLMLFAFIGLLMFDQSAFLLAGAAAFLACIHVAFLEVKFVFDIWTVQVGEPENARRERLRRTVAVAPTAGNTRSSGSTMRIAGEVTTTTIEAPLQPAADSTETVAPAAVDGLPLPVTAQPAVPTVVGSDGEMIPPRASFASLYSRFYFTLINLLFFSLWALSWPKGARAIYANILAFCLFSLWLPQIYRNTMRNCRKALNWEYVIGTSALRAVPILYWYVADRNILSATVSPRAALLLIAWLTFQICVLLAQQFLGPRIFVKEAWCPPAYDYHPVLFDDLEAGGLPIGELTSATEGKDKTEQGDRKVFDCAICMNEIDVPVVNKKEAVNGRSWLEQRNYMVTPCRHIFHTECLEGWLNLRLVCPVCREGLPPL